MSNKNCCVVGCFNTSRKRPGLHFYTFPKKSWLREKRNKWIIAVRRKNEDGTAWSPNDNTRICSAHFVGGEKSEHPQSPAYIPTIFTSKYMKASNAAHAKSKFARFERIKNRTEATNSELYDSLPGYTDPDLEVTKDVSTQTDYAENDNSLFPCNVIMLEREGNNVSIQSSSLRIIHSCDVSTMTHFRTEGTRKIDLCDKSCGPNTNTEDIIQQIKNLPSTFLSKSVCDIEGISDKQLKQMAGVSKPVFAALLNFVRNFVCHKKSRRLKVSQSNRLFLFLIKCKTGLNNTVLAYFFKIDRTQVQNIFIEVLTILISKIGNWIFWPSKQAIRETMPPSFQDFPNCRAIIDCTEIKIEKSSSVEQQNILYSNYKSMHTLKVLVAIAPNGMITFVSKCYGGRATDSYITQDCGILNLIERNDLIMADKGFPQIKTDIENNNAILVMPPFAKTGQDQFEAHEVQTCYKIAKERVHVERAIQRIKIYKILDKVSLEMIPYIDEVFRVCCILSNLQAPIIKQYT